MGPCAHPVKALGITTRTLLDMFGPRRIDLMKMDCEGCELNGLSPLGKPEVRKRIQRFAGELHQGRLQKDNPGLCEDFDQALEDIACFYDGGRYLIANECGKVRPLRCEVEKLVV